MKLKYTLSFAAVLGVISITSFFIGRLSMPKEQAAVHRATAPTLFKPAQAPIRAAEPFTESDSSQAGNNLTPPNLGQEVNEAINGSAIENYEYEQSLATVENLQSLIEAAPESEEKYAEIQSIKQAMLDRAKVNSNALEALITAYKDQPSTITGANLQAVLAEIKDPEVERAAIDLANSSEPAEQLAGLNLLSELNIPSQASFNAASNLISSSDNPDVIMAALSAIPEIPLPDSEFNELINNLNQLASSSDNEAVQSASIFKLGEQAKESEELQVVMNALSASGSTDTRISAAMALKQSPLVGDDIKNVLIDRLKDQNELWEIRRLAAESLERFKLSQNDYEAYKNFLEQQGDIALSN